MNLRQAAQHALKVMDDHMYRADTHEFYEAKEALRAALAEPEQEPVAWMDREGDVYKELPSPHWCPPHTPLYAHPPTPRKPLTDEEIVRLMVGEDRVQLLYAKPGDPYFSEFAEGAIRELVESGRAIEKAHGIGEQT